MANGADGSKSNLAQPSILGKKISSERIDIFLNNSDDAPDDGGRA